MDVLKKHLMENEGIAESEIAIATGEQRELDAINLFDKTCPINYIITIEALKEGWDCSFAYVFCSVANIRSAVDVEQLLGRVMRMPYAKKRRIEELNNAYAHTISPSFESAVDNMYDRLVSMGFDAEEAADSIVQPLPLPGVDWDTLPLFEKKAEPLALELPKAPKFEALPEEERKQITVTQTESGSYSVVFRGSVSEEAEKAMVEAAPKQAEEVRRKVAIHRAQERQRQPLAPSQKGQPFTVGQLMLKLWDSLELPEQETILMATDWSPLRYDKGMLPEEFAYDESARTFIFDLEGERMRYHQAEEQIQYSLLASTSNMNDRDLSRWLDRQCRQGDIRQEDMLEFCRRSVESLLQRGSFDIELLSRAKYALAAALKSKLEKLRLQALKDGYQQLLFSSERNAEINFNDPHRFPLSGYAESYPALVERGYKFQKHYYQAIRDLKAVGEEYDCARTIDMHPQIEFWVRNVDRQDGSFWLPLHNGKFYPDFVAKLKDGRTLVVEYKGKHLLGTADTQEKQNIGELWAETGKGENIFLMAVEKDTHGRPVDKQIAAVITSA